MLTDQQREQLARLAVGDTTVLVDEYNGPTIETTREGHFVIDAAQSLAILDYAPHGKVGDGFKTDDSCAKKRPPYFDGWTTDRTFRVKSVEVTTAWKAAMAAGSHLYLPEDFMEQYPDPSTPVSLTEVERLK